MVIDPDLALVLGLALVAFSVPAMLAALSESRGPRVSGLVLLAGGGLMVFAMVTKPGGYTMQSMADAVLNVIGNLLS